MSQLRGWSSVGLLVFLAAAMFAGGCGPMDITHERSVSPLPKDQLLPVAAALRQVVLDAPVHDGQLVLADALGTGVDIRATRDLLGE